MRLLADRKIKLLFWRVLLILMVSTLLFAAFTSLKFEYAILYTILCSLSMGGAILAAGFRYFKARDEMMEAAVMRIKEYISGNPDARIECDDEGGLYRLFHEVNSLAAVLNAHAENEGKAKKFLKDAISDISHQLKTPLAALNVYNGIMQEEAGKLQTIKEFTALSEQELDRIEILVQNLLKITKLDAGTIVLEKSQENVSEMLGCIERHFSYRTRLEEKKLSLTGDETTVLLCDRIWFIEAVSNIVKNALDHTEKGNAIQMEWKEFASVVQIIIKDNGRGIHEEDLYHIFKRFYRSRFSKDTKGSGLGLPLAKSIIEAHHGTIEVDSELGSGTIFTVNFLIPTKL